MHVFLVLVSISDHFFVNCPRKTGVRKSLLNFIDHRSYKHFNEGTSSMILNMFLRTSLKINQI